MTYLKNGSGSRLNGGRGCAVEVLVEPQQAVVATIALIEATLTLTIVTIILRRDTLATLTARRLVRIDSILTTMVGIVLITALLSLVSSRAYRSTYRGSACHAYQRSDIPTMPSACYATYSRTNNRTKTTSCDST